MDALFRPVRVPTFNLAFSVLLSFFVFSTIGPADGVIVTITQKAPMETLSATGDVIGVAEAAVGTKMTFVSTDGSQVTLQDAQGTHYQIALAATDYTPPLIPAPTNSMAQAPAATNNVAQQPVMTSPPAGSQPTPPPGPTAGSGDLPADSMTATVAIEDRNDYMKVWPPTGISGRPLLIAAHGNGGTGEGEIARWRETARQHHFTIVCSTFPCSTGYLNQINADASYFKKALRWIADNLQYDKDNAFMCGFSGGGFPTWYFATKYPEIFRGLFFQSANFYGGFPDFDLSKWYRKPIKMIWGTQDRPDIPTQNQQALDALKQAGCKNYTSEVVQGGKHEEHPDLVAAWMEQVMAAPVPSD